MFLIDGVLWLAALPFRLVIWLVGMTTWTITLPFRVVWGILSFFGIGRILTLGILGAAGYALWRLVSDDEVPVPAPPPLDPVAGPAPSVPVDAGGSAPGTASATRAPA